MASNDCYSKGPSIFVLFQQDLGLLDSFLSAEEKRKTCIHKYGNGFLVSFDGADSWILCVLMLQDKKVFHQKYYQGRCVHTRNHIEKGERFLTYEGRLCTEEPEGDDTYVFEFAFKGKTYWIDATVEDATFGRLLNDSEDPNGKVKVSSSDGNPCLAFYSIKEIDKDEEIVYNYGPGPYPWRIKRKKRDPAEQDGKTEDMDDGERSFSNTAEVDWENSVHNTAEEEGETSVHNTAEKEGATSVHNTAKEEVETSVHNTADEEGATSVHNTAEKEVETSVHNTAEEEVETSVHNTAEEEGENSVHNTAEVELENSISNIAEVELGNSVSNTAEVDGENSVSNTAEVNGENSVHNTAEVEVENSISNIAEVELENSVHNTAEVDGENSAHNTAEEEGENSVHNTAEVELENSVNITAEEDGGNSAHNTAEEEGENSVHNIAEEEGENSVSNIAEVEWENSVHNTSEVKEENSISNKAEVEVENSISNIAEVELENSVHNTAEVDGENSAHNTAEEEGENSVHNTAEVELENSVNNTAEEDGEDSAHNTAEKEGENSVHNTAEVELENSISNIAEVELGNSVSNTAEVDGENSVSNTAEVNGENSVHSTAEVEVENSISNIAEVELENSVHNTAEVDGENSAHNTAEEELENSVNITAEEDGGNSAHNTAEEEGENSVHNIAEEEGENSVSNIAEVEWENSVHNTSEVKEENSVSNIAEVRVESSVHNTAEVEGENSVSNIAEVEVENNVSNIAEVEVENSVCNTAEVDGEDSAHNTAEEEVENSISNTAEVNGENIVNTAEVEVENSISNKAEVEVENSISNIAEVELENSVHNTAEVDGENSAHNTAEEEGENSVHNTAEVELENSVNNTAEEDGEDSAHNTAEKEGENSVHNTAEEEGENGVHNTAEVEWESSAGNPAEVEETAPSGENAVREEIVFVASGSSSMKAKLKVFVEIFGVKYLHNFEDKVTHVIVQTVSPRICDRSLKYLQGIAHHCWILDQQYVEDSLKAGYLMSEENYEIHGDTVFPYASGPAISRKKKAKLFQHINIKLVGKVDNFPKEAAEDILISQGADLKEEGAIIVSINETGEGETIMRDWIFDCLSTYRLIDRKDYLISEQRMESNESRIETNLPSVTDHNDDDYQPPSVTDHSDDDYQPPSVTDHSDDDYQPPSVTDHSDDDNKECSGTGQEECLPSQSNDNDSNTKCHPPLCINGEKLFVSKSKKTEIGKRIWDKKHPCCYCDSDKLYSKLARHMEDVHKSEFDVARALAFPVGSKERKMVWRMLTNRGDHFHNMAVRESGKGEIIPYKRPKNEIKATEYMPCVHCFGSFLRKDLWRHVKKCPFRQDKSSQKGRFHHQAASASLLPVAKSVSKKFREDILDTLANDDISLVVRGDPDIISFGERKYMKCAANPHQYQYVRQKLRELARFLQHARNVDNSVMSIKDCIDSLKFQMCVDAVKLACGFDEDTLKFKIPSLALKLGHSLHKIARKLSTDGRKLGDSVLTETAEGFIKVYVEDWETEISSAALETQRLNKYNKPKCIPAAADIQLLSRYLQQSANTYLPSESDKINEREWRGLCEVTLAQIVLFNKRRAGEAERMTLEQYNKGLKQGKTMQEEVLLSLSPFERKLAESIARIEIRGKGGKRVPVLLPKLLKQQLKLLVENRNSGGISTTNKFVFARRGDAKTPLRSTDVLRKYARECGAKDPELLTTTSFRKHIAVISQMINLKENELDTLAGFLGHNIKVHRDFYRLPEDTLQVAKISKILLEMERGQIHLYKGKTLDEIQLDPEAEELIQDDDDDEIEARKTSEMDESGVVTMAENTLETEQSNNSGMEGHVMTSSRVVTSTKRSTNIKPWSEEEKSAVRRQLGKFFAIDKLPGKHDIEVAIKKEPVLSNRPWAQIKFFIRNTKYSESRYKIKDLFSK